MSDLGESESKTLVKPQFYAAEGSDEEVGIVNKGAKLHTDLRSRHIQMIAIGRQYSP